MYIVLEDRRFVDCREEASVGALVSCRWIIWMCANLVKTLSKLVLPVQRWYQSVVLYRSYSVWSIPQAPSPSSTSFRWTALPPTPQRGMINQRSDTAVETMRSRDWSPRLWSSRMVGMESNDSVCSDWLVVGVVIMSDWCPGRIRDIKLRIPKGDSKDWKR